MDTSSTDAMAAMTTPGAVGCDGVLELNRSTISPAKTAGMS
jgi:hypothetical protein